MQSGSKRKRDKQNNIEVQHPVAWQLGLLSQISLGQCFINAWKGKGPLNEIQKSNSSPSVNQTLSTVQSYKNGSYHNRSHNRFQLRLKLSLLGLPHLGWTWRLALSQVSRKNPSPSPPPPPSSSAILGILVVKGYMSGYAFNS